MTMKKDTFSKIVYGDFIKNLNLKELKMISVNTTLDESFVPPANLKITDDAKYENLDEKQLKIIVHYHLEALKKDTEKSGLTIDVTYSLMYSSDMPMIDDFFKIYRQSSLRIQTWPYFRQLVHQLTLDMHLPPLVLDTIKAPV
jgi:preprotein translocase subunit SecB